MARPFQKVLDPLLNRVRNALLDQSAWVRGGSDGAALPVARQARICIGKRCRRNQFFWHSAFFVPGAWWLSMKNLRQSPEGSRACGSSCLPELPCLP